MTMIENAAWSKRLPDPRRPSVVTYGMPVLLALLTSIIAWWSMGGSAIHIRDPFQYSTDGPLILLMIKRVMEGNWLFHSSLMGAPFGSEFYDYPVPDSGSLLILKWIGIAFHSPALAYNVYYLLGFPIDAVTAYWVLRRFRIARPLSFCGGFIFTLIPFHFERLGHLFYTWYFVAPLFIWFSYNIYIEKDERPFFGRQRFQQHIKNALFLLALSCFGVYYAFFGVLTFMTAGLMRFLHTPSIKSLQSTVLAVVLVSVGILANITPNLLDRYQHGINAEVAARSPVEAELYGLKVVQLLLPREGHRFPPFATLAAEYKATFPLVNENSTASLGMVGSIGFILLLFTFLIQRKDLDSRLFFLSAVSLVLVLFCSIGGFSALFALLISPMIRAWNRVSVFISFVSLAAVMLMCDRALAFKWATRQRTLWTGLTALVLCLFALWDQSTPPCIPCIRATQADFSNDAHFVSEIEQRVTKGSAIYQLPYLGFPEVPSLNQLAAYDLSHGYLESTSLKWSWGAIKGTKPDLFFRALSARPIAEQIRIARQLCFAGIYLDRRGYADNGAAVVAEIQHVLGTAPAIASPNSQQIFFDLGKPASAGCTAQSQMTPQALSDKASKLLDK